MASRPPKPKSKRAPNQTPASLHVVSWLVVFLFVWVLVSGALVLLSWHMSPLLVSVILALALMSPLVLLRDSNN